jgi:hypothetical protein
VGRPLLCKRWVGVAAAAADDDDVADGVAVVAATRTDSESCRNSLYDDAMDQNVAPDATRDEQ